MTSAGVKTGGAGESRGEATRHQMMRAAERLFARHGIENVSVRAIIVEAGQKNESALQYHFGSRDGLIAALHEQRARQVNALRLAKLEVLSARGGDISLRELCEVLVTTPIELCRDDPGFRAYLGVFSQVVLSSSRRVIATLEAEQSAVWMQIQQLMEQHLQQRAERAGGAPGADSDHALFLSRFEDAARFAILSISRRARSRDTFQGLEAELFLSNLLDVMTAMLEAAESDQTRALLRVMST